MSLRTRTGGKRTSSELLSLNDQYGITPILIPTLIIRR